MITEKHICIINVPSEMKIICYYIVFSMTERLMIMNYISNHRETIGG